MPSSSTRLRGVVAALALSTTLTGVTGLSMMTTITPAHASVPASDTTTFPVLRQGTSGTAVKVLQAALNNAGAGISVDGAFGAGTGTAVSHFQSSHGLGADGVVGANTWAALLSTVSSSSTTSWMTKAVQIGVGTTVDGAWGSATTSAVKALQTSKHLTADGIVGPDTWGAILGATVTAPPSGPTTGTVVGDYHQPSDTVACATGTRDLGTAQAAYIDGKALKTRLCAITGLRSSGEESTPGDKYYVAGANGEAVVNSRVSGAFAAIFTISKQKGVALSATSSFRTMQHQKDLCSQNANCRAGGNASVAQPGNSPHQTGLAVDFAGPGTTGGSTGCSARATDTSSTVWKFLAATAPSHGIKQYSGESWHWDARIDLANRC